MKKLLVLAMLLSSCAKIGTDTGNPAENGGLTGCDGNRRCLPTPYPIILAGTISNKAKECVAEPKPEDDFHSLVMSQPGLNFEINLPNTSLASLQNDYDDKKINVDIEAFGDCVNEIQALSCTSQIFTDAYDVNNWMDFSRIHKILRSDLSCNAMFSVKE